MGGIYFGGFFDDSSRGEHGIVTPFFTRENTNETRALVLEWLDFYV